MAFVFPGARLNECEEQEAYRFQRCAFCGWCGDAVNGIRLDIGRDIWGGYRINGTHYATLLAYLKAVHLCL